VLAVTLVAAVLTLVGLRVVLASGGLPTGTDPADMVGVAVGTALHLTVVALVGSGFRVAAAQHRRGDRLRRGPARRPPGARVPLPASVAQVVRPPLPDVAGAAVYQPVPDLIGPWTGFAVFASYAAVVLMAGLADVRRRDVGPPGTDARTRTPDRTWPGRRTVGVRRP
jgi:hypothetical protein